MAFARRATALTQAGQPLGVGASGSNGGGSSSSGARPPPRPDQLECLKRIIDGNIIVHKPTGTGKTLIAVLSIDHFLQQPPGKVLFVVPTRALVEQQANVVRKQCERQPMEVLELQGGSTLDIEGERERLAYADVIVGTPDMLRRWLVDSGILDVRDFSLVIFDECHNATGNSAMAAIMRDAVHRAGSDSDGNMGPRILGLTASFVNGATSDMEERRRQLEGLLQAPIFCPQPPPDAPSSSASASANAGDGIASGSAAGGLREADFEQVSFDPRKGVDPRDAQRIEDMMQELMSCFPALEGKKDVLRRGKHVFSELGMSAFLYYLRDSVAHELKNLLERQLEQVSDSKQKETLQQAKKRVLLLVEGYDQRMRRAKTTLPPMVTDKAVKLFDVLDVEHDRAVRRRASTARIIIFCEQTVLACPLAHLVSEHTRRSAATCTGVGSMSDTQRSQALADFRSGRVPVLVCTAAVEEGLDVSECEVVIRFSAFKTTKSHIQGAGRARMANARIYYFGNDPEAERAAAEALEAVARAESLALTEEERELRRQQRDIEGVHPWRTEIGSEISVFNCARIVNEYAQKVMAQTFRPDETMFEYVYEPIPGQPLQKRKRIVAAHLPSPEGFVTVREDEVDEFWGEYGIDDVTDNERTRNWDLATRDHRRFVYVAAVILSRRGHLDKHNEPSAKAVRETPIKCPAWPMRQSLRINPKYAADAVTTSPTSAPSGAASSSASGILSEDELDDLKDAKSNLNDLTGGKAKYETAQREGGAWVSTVILPFPDGRTVSSRPSSSKKIAEQLAAAAALKLLQPHRQAPAQERQDTAGTGNGDGDGAAGPPPEGPQGYPSSSSSSVLRCPPAAPVPAAATAENYKSKVNELTCTRATYTTLEVGGGFISTLLLPDGAEFRGSAAAPRKKDAEQLAAKAYLEAAGFLGTDTRTSSQASMPSPAASAGATSTSAGSASLQPSDIVEQVLHELGMEEALTALDLARRCGGAPKAVLNRFLYEMQEQGLVEKVCDSPPTWSLVGR